LLESVIAITIIATCLLIAIRLYAMILSHTTSMNSYQAKFKVAQLYDEIKLSGDFENELYEYTTFSIKKEVNDYQGNKELQHVQLKVQTVVDTIVYNYIVPKIRS